MDSKKVSHIFAIFLMIIWGMSYLSIKVVLLEVGPMLCAFYRFIIAATILFIFMKVKYPEEKVLKKDRFKMALGGLFGVGLYFYFENYSVLFTSVSNVAILISSIPVFTLVSQRIIFKEKMNYGKIFGAILSVVGIVIIIATKEKVSLFSKGTLGDVLALGAAFCWVIYNIVNTKIQGKYKSITVTTSQMLWGCLFLSPALFLEKISIPSNLVIANLVFLSIFCSCIGYVLYVYCLEHLGATVITTYINLQPMVSLVSAWLILGDKIQLSQIVGCVVIISGVFLVSFSHGFKLEKS